MPLLRAISMRARARAHGVLNESRMLSEVVGRAVLLRAGFRSRFQSPQPHTARLLRGEQIAIRTESGVSAIKACYLLAAGPGIPKVHLAIGTGDDQQFVIGTQLEMGGPETSAEGRASLSGGQVPKLNR